MTHFAGLRRHAHHLGPARQQIRPELRNHPVRQHRGQGQLPQLLVLTVGVRLPGHDLHSSSFLIQNSSFLIHNSSSLIQNSSFLIHNSSSLIQSFSFSIHNSSFWIQNSSFLIQDFSFLIQNPSFSVRNASLFTHVRQRIRQRLRAARFITFNTKFLVFDTNFNIFTHLGASSAATSISIASARLFPAIALQMHHFKYEIHHF